MVLARRSGPRPVHLVWRYVDTAVAGSGVFDASTAREGTTTWPLPQGWYRVVDDFDDGYPSLAVSAPFRVVKSPSGRQERSRRSRAARRAAATRVGAVPPMTSQVASAPSTEAAVRR